jgi:hypothetical protein
MPTHQTVAKFKDLDPVCLHDASGHADEASFVAEYDHRIATDNEFVSREFLKLEPIMDAMPGVGGALEPYQIFWKRGRDLFRRPTASSDQHRLALIPSAA